jgi:methyl-accepting chemotaxis protein
MRIFQNLSLQQKFGSVGVISALLLCLSLATSVNGIRKMASEFSTYVERDQAISLALKDMYAQGLQSEQATRNILLNPSDEKAAKNYLQAMEDFDKAYQIAAAKGSDQPEAKAEMDQVAATWKEAAAMRLQVQTLAKEGKSQEALDLLIKQETPKWRQIKEKLFHLGSERMKHMESSKTDIMALSGRTLAISLGLGGFAILCTVLLMLVAVMGMTHSIRHISEMIDDIAHGEGDLTKRLNVTSTDELGRLAGAFNLFIDKLHGLISAVARTTAQVSSAAVELNATAEQIANGTEEVAAQAATVATAGEEMTSTSTSIAHNCSIAAEGSKRASDSAYAGAAVVQQTVQGMGRIAECVKESARTVESLGARSDQIGTIILTIEDIADQTNLLALNAAIEAARAGEQGRGFAVVADEVRALAERTTKATKEIDQMIKTIQGETRSAVGVMEDGVREVEKGTSEAARSGEALKDILTQINEVTQQVDQITVAAEEQTATTSEISNNIQQITQVVHGTAQGAQQSAAAARQLSQLAESLQGVVNHFKLR